MALRGGLVQCDGHLVRKGQVDPGMPGMCTQGVHTGEAGCLPAKDRGFWRSLPADGRVRVQPPDPRRCVLSSECAG